MCPFARAFSEYAACVEAVDGVVFTTSCDQMRRAPELAALWRGQPVFLMNVPATRQSSIAERMYVAELQRLGRYLRSLGGREPNSDRLIRTILEREETQQPQSPEPPADKPPVAPVDAVDSAARIRLAIAGGPIPENSPFIQQLEQAGGTVVLDATDGGERTWPATSSRGRLRTDPLGELARSHLAIPSVHQRPNDALFAWLQAEIVARSVRGLILRRYVWCDLWHAEARRLADMLDVPVLDLEMDGDCEEIDAPAMSRVEGFIDMLKQHIYASEC
jgi:benzoyl-CoA reductase/2-hydroxyglutaryl-CoA dehydratase subunit BcrC/BadD/HgdB